MKWILTFGLQDFSFDSFKDAFEALKEKWKAQASPQMLETIWITNPHTNKPMFYLAICKMADELNLP